MTRRPQAGLSGLDMLLLWLVTALWLAGFIVGTLVNSAPYRESFAAFEGGIVGTMKSGLLVVVTYTLTNVAVLCMLAGVLGELGATAILASHTQEGQVPDRDRTSPRSSAVLRSFLVYLTLIAGVLVLGKDPIRPTQEHYVRLAGAISLVAFAVNYRPTIFGRMLERAGRLVAEGKPATPPANGIAKLADLHNSGALSDEEFRMAKQKMISG